MSPREHQADRPFTAYCDECGYQWDLPLRLPMPMNRAAEAMKGFVAAGCPSCGSYGKHIICGVEPRAEAKP